MSLLGVNKSMKIDPLAVDGALCCEVFLKYGSLVLARGPQGAAFSRAVDNF